MAVRKVSAPVCGEQRSRPGVAYGAGYFLAVRHFCKAIAPTTTTSNVNGR